MALVTEPHAHAAAISAAAAGEIKKEESCCVRENFKRNKKKYKRNQPKEI